MTYTFAFAIFRRGGGRQMAIQALVTAVLARWQYCGFNRMNVRSRRVQCVARYYASVKK